MARGSPASWRASAVRGGLSLARAQPALANGPFLVVVPSSRRRRRGAFLATPASWWSSQEPDVRAAVAARSMALGHGRSARLARRRRALHQLRILTVHPERPHAYPEGALALRTLQRGGPTRGRRRHPRTTAQRRQSPLLAIGEAAIGGAADREPACPQPQHALRWLLSTGCSTTACACTRRESSPLSIGLQSPGL